MTVTDPTVDTDHAGPYAQAALTYHAAGWAPLPLPTRRKAHPPKGWTGTRAPWPSGPDVYAWTETHATGNLALRLPPDVLGIDVDHYGDKPGGHTLAELQHTHGPLPATWRSTSRDDGTSGIRLFRVPPGLRWPGILGPGIEVLRHGHRYAVAWPSLHPDTGSTYRWISPDGTTVLHDIPTPDQLPPLPETWVEHFTAGEHADEQDRADLADSDVADWLTARRGHPCRRLRRVLEQTLTHLGTATSRHDHMLTATNRLIWLAGQGHPGAPALLSQARLAFFEATAGDRAGGEAEAEWRRMVTGAVRIAAAAHPTTPPPDPCTPRPAPPTVDTGPPPQAPPAAQDQERSQDEDAVERTSWWPRDNDAALTDDSPEPPPAFLVRDDGHALFYPGRVNGILGPSESGKTWVVLLGVAQAVTTGHRVTILDFEDSHKGITGRLLALGLTREQVRTQVAYIGPDEPLAPFMPTGRDLSEHLAAWQPTLLVLDGFNAAMTLQGLDLISNKDATTFAQTILKPLAKNGVCVVYVDHTPKDKENASAGGIGAQAKRAMTTGCALKVEVIRAFGKGQEGKLRLHVDKDRQGDVRGVSAPSRTGHWAGDVTITPDEELVTVQLAVPAGFDADHPDRPAEFRPTFLMERVSKYLLVNPGAGRNEVVSGVKGDDKALKEALRILLAEGWVKTEDGPGRKRLHTVVRAYSEAAEKHSTAPPNEWGWTGGATGGAPPVETTGGGGGVEGDVVPSHTTPSQPASATPGVAGGGATPSHHRSRLDTGEQVWIDPHTGEVTDATTERPGKEDSR